MKIKEIAQEAVNIWKEDPSMDYLEAIELAEKIFEERIGVDRNDTRRSGGTIR